MKAWIAAAALLFAAPLAAKPQDITAPGTVAHRDARTGFPETIGDFRRISVTRYDPFGRDVSANYQLVRPEGQVRMSVYIYPADAFGPVPAGDDGMRGFCREHFEGVEAAIRQSHQGAERLETDPPSVRGGLDPDLAHRSRFRISADIGRGPEALVSEARLYCFAGGNWLVKYRISASAGLDASAAIDNFVRLGPWPGYMPGEVASR